MVIYKSQVFSYLKNSNSRWLYLLLGIDITLLILHVASVFGYVGLSFSVARSFGYGELFQYAKFTLLALTLGYMARHWRSNLLACWSAVFFFLLIDDSLEIHEQGGIALTQAIGSLPGIGPEMLVNMAEAAVLCSIGGLLILPVLYFHFRRNKQSITRLISQDILLLMIAMAFFSVVIDFVHSFAPPKTWLRGAFTLLEEGGEMMILSLTAWYTIHTAKTHSIIRKQPLVSARPTNYPIP